MISSERIRDFLQNLNYEDLRQKLNNIDDSEFLHALALNYNWDNGFELPKLIIENSNCEVGTALMLFYNADGYIVLEKGIKNIENGQKDWSNFITILFNKIENNEFKSENIYYEPELSKVQKFNLKKINPNISDIFIDGVNS